MAAKFVILFACIAVAACGVSRREAAATESPLQQLAKDAAEVQKTFSAQLGKLADSKNTQELNKALKDGSDSVLQQLSAFSSSLQSALSDANGKAAAALQEARAGVERSAAELRAAHPELEQSATALREQLAGAVQSVAARAQALAHEVGANIEQTNDKLAPKIKQAFDEFAKQADDVQKKIHAAATKQ